MYSPRIDRAFYRMVFTLVLPIAVQQLINACITSADIMMLGRVSESAIAGVSLAGQISFLLNLILIGISSGASILCSQYWGKKDLRSIEELMGFSLCAGLFVSVIFTVTAFCAPLSVMGLFTSDPVIADQGAQYLRIVCFSYPLNCCTFIYLSIMRSMEHVKISSIIYLFSLLINVFLNYVFIFGHFGSPALGTAGAAAGTCGARLSELVLAWIYEKKYNRTARFHLRSLYVKNIALVRRFFHFALPVLMNELAWGLGYTVLASIIGHLGQNIVAANSVITVLRQLSMIFSTGLASAAAIITGKTIGEGNRPLVLNYSRNFIKLSVVFGCLGAAAILILAFASGSFIRLSPQSGNYLKIMTALISFICIFQSINSTIVLGILRSGGDTKAGMIMDLVSLWGIALLFGWLSAFIWKLPFPIIYMFLVCDELVKFPFPMKRYFSYKWLNDVTS